MSLHLHTSCFGGVFVEFASFCVLERKKHLIRSHCLKEPEAFATSSWRLERPGPESQVQAKEEEHSRFFHCQIIGPFHSAYRLRAFRIDTRTDETKLDYTSFLWYLIPVIFCKTNLIVHSNGIEWEKCIMNVLRLNFRADVNQFYYIQQMV